MTIRSLEDADAAILRANELLEEAKKVPLFPISGWQRKIETAKRLVSLATAWMDANPE